MNNDEDNFRNGIERLDFWMRKDENILKVIRSEVNGLRIGGYFSL